MAITYTWSVTDMRHTTSDGGVYEVDWQISATENNLTGVHTDTFYCEADPSDPSFVAYESLTEAIVLGWVKGNPENTVFVTWAKRVADSFLEEVKQENATGSGLPWS